MTFLMVEYFELTSRTFETSAPHCRSIMVYNFRGRIYDSWKNEIPNLLAITDDLKSNHQVIHYLKENLKHL